MEWFPNMNEMVVTVVSSFLGAAILTRLTRTFAHRIGLVDCPDGRRKLHKLPIALGGGLAVFVATVVGVAVAVMLNPALLAEDDESFFLGLVGSTVLIVGVGLADDRFHLRGRQKLLGQFVSVGILVCSGLVVRNVRVFDWNIELGLLAIPFTMFWLIGAINALNLIDGLDGLAGSVGVIFSLAIAGMSVLGGHGVDAMISIALCGALIGFLIYNLPPASIYLGDAGSMFIGLLLGTMAIRSSLKGAATVAMMAPTVIWAIPILDVGMAILRRKLTGRSIYETDRGHLHHCLLRHGFSGRMTLAWIGLFSAITAGGALISVARQNEWVAVITVVAVCGTLVLTRMFGFAECMLLGGRLKSLFSSLIPKPNRTSGGQSSPFHARLTGSRDWDDLWGTLTEYAERFDLSSVQLNVNLPALNEEYHVNWNRKDRGPDRQQWSSDIPLIANGVTVGRLRISGRSTEGSICSWMGDLIEGLKPFEMQMLELVNDQIQGANFLEPREHESTPSQVEPIVGQVVV